MSSQRPGRGQQPPSISRQPNNRSSRIARFVLKIGGANIENRPLIDARGRSGTHWRKAELLAEQAAAALDEYVGQ
jgi:hypothetical protein